MTKTLFASPVTAATLLCLLACGCSRHQRTAVELRNGGREALTDVHYDYGVGVVPAGFVKQGSYKVGHVWRPREWHPQVLRWRDAKGVEHEVSPPEADIWKTPKDGIMILVITSPNVAVSYETRYAN